MAPGFKANLTYYWIDYNNRIANPNLSVPLLNTFVDESVLGSQIVIRNPSTSQVQQLINSAGGNYSNPFNLSTIGAIADERLANLSSQRTNGLDFGASYITVFGPVGNVEFGLDGTKILKYSNRVSAGSPAISILNTTSNPVDLRLRGRGIVTHDNWTYALFVNYVDSYINNAAVTPVAISSWTTFDFNASYRFGAGSGLMRNLLLTFGVNNILNRAPPYANVDPFNAIYYDGANANPLGRFVYVQLSKHF